MLLRKIREARNPQQPSARPSREEIIALSLGCMHEYAEKLAAQALQNGVFTARQPLCDCHPEKS